jgi:hypothetical protein
MDEDGSLIVTLLSGDIDGGDPSYSASSDESNVSVSVTGDQLTLTPADNWNGTANITVTVDDGSGGTDGETFVLLVNPVNDAPELSDIGAQSMDEDGSLIVTLLSGDIDGGDPSYSASSDESNVSVSVTGDQLTLTPADNWNGTANITVTVDDGSGGTDGETFVLTVNPVNDVPGATNVAIDPAVPSINEDLVLTYDYFDIEGDDESGTTINWYKDGLEQPEFADQSTIPGSATSCDEEWYAEVRPNDGIDFGNPVNSNTVTICAGNTAPQWSEIDDQHINEDSEENTVDITPYIYDNEQAPSQIVFTVLENSGPDHLGAEFVGTNLILTTLVQDYKSILSVE